MSQHYAESLGLGSYGNIVPTSVFADAFLVSSKFPKAEPAIISIKDQLINILGFAGHMVNLCDSYSTPHW